jgi:hypothetical protein
MYIPAKPAPTTTASNVFESVATELLALLLVIDLFPSLYFEDFELDRMRRDCTQPIRSLDRKRENLVIACR